MQAQTEKDVSDAKSVATLESRNRKSRKDRKAVRQQKASDPAMNIDPKTVDSPEQRRLTTPKIDVPAEQLQVLEQIKKQESEKKTQKKTESRFKGNEDFLLEDFSENQKEFIIKELYPSLKQAMMHVSVADLLTTFSL